MFNSSSLDSEKARNPKCIIKMDGQKTIITNPENGGGFFFSDETF